ncbi:hypothetical protein AB0D08_09175 [Kitasatospora sp. NPDC048540]|uniref:hypothetical protein n=1 Tax=unclassified Kitasatospora TaxID=2633591 RepID=UPI00053A6C2E|nr:hypothetical protein [Kitasatospora sp. MBT63]
MGELFDDNGVVHRLIAVTGLGVSLLLLDLGLAQYRQGGSMAWAVIAGVLVLATGYETVRRFRRDR